MKAVFIGSNPQIAETAKLALCLHWPSVIVIDADNASEGLDLIKQESPDVVLYHPVIEDMDLFEAIGALRSFSEVPLMVLGVSADGLELVEALALGADDYVNLPCNATWLVVRIIALLRRIDRRAAMALGQGSIRWPAPVAYVQLTG